MPVCAKCSKQYPIKIIIDGRIRNLQHRKFCFECSPFGFHNTAALDKGTKGDKCTCQFCDREFIYSRNGDTREKCTSCRQKIKMKERKKLYLNLKGNKCQCCDYDRCSEALDFHHLDEKSKKFDMSLSYNISLSRALKELDKCVLLCCRCHREIHNGIEVKIKT